MINLIFDNLLQIHGGGHDSIGILKVLEDFLSFLELLTQQSLAENFASLLPGISSLNNLHPMVVHFPIALFTIFFLTDLFGSLLKNKLWRQCATGLLYAGTLSAILTVILGFQAAHSIEHNDAVHQIMLRHQILGISVTILAIILSIRRFFANENFLNTATYGHFSLSAILMILLIFGADLGALMVYEHGTAVNIKPVQALKITPETIYNYFTEQPAQHIEKQHSHDHSGHSHAH